MQAFVFIVLVKIGGFMLEDFRAKLKKDRKSIKDFIIEYLPELSYSTVSLQINGFNRLQDEVKEAIEKYIGK